MIEDDRSGLHDQMNEVLTKPTGGLLSGCRKSGTSVRLFSIRAMAIVYLVTLGDLEIRCGARDRVNVLFNSNQNVIPIQHRTLRTGHAESRK